MLSNTISTLPPDQFADLATQMIETALELLGAVSDGLFRLVGTLIGVVLAASYAMKNWQDQQLRKQLHDISYECKSQLILLREYYKIARSPFFYTNRAKNNSEDGSTDESQDPFVAYREQWESRIQPLHDCMTRTENELVKLEALTDQDIWPLVKPLRRKYIEYRQAVDRLCSDDKWTRNQAQSSERILRVATHEHSDEVDKFQAELYAALEDAITKVSKFMLKRTHKGTPTAVSNPPA